MIASPEMQWMILIIYSQNYWLGPKCHNFFLDCQENLDKLTEVDQTILTFASIAEKYSIAVFTSYSFIHF